VHYSDMIMPHKDSIMSEAAIVPVLARRTLRKWSQAELAKRAGISRTEVSAIEGRRLTPSVTAALSLAAALECSVEELFAGSETSAPHEPEWAWTPRTNACRYWEAEVNRCRLLYPVEAVGLNPLAHDGIWERGVFREMSPPTGNTTLTIACCDPAAGLLAAEYARATGFRLLVFPRNGNAALDLVRQRLVHVAGLHRSTTENPQRNAQTVSAQFGENYRLLRAARWEEGIALPANDQTRSTKSVARCPRRWAARETGSAARECLDELLEGRRFSGREVNGHSAVAEAVRAGWAEAGVCVRFSAEEAALNFLPMRTEDLDFCFSAALQHDPRVQALIRLLRSRAYRRLVSELPGYDARETGEVMSI
jgi:molybdate-binding protein/transcriptional regulator with XRE-family HTH domain